MSNRLLAAASLVAAASMSTWGAEGQSIFPLQVGNQWVLQSNLTTSTSPELLTIEVLRSRIQNGETYYLLSGYAPEQRWVRLLSDGQLVALNETNGTDELLAHLTTSVATYRTTLGGCEQTAQPDPRPALHRGPNYQLDNAVTIQYAAESCRDIGLGTEVYAPGVGLVQRSVTTIRGGFTFDLVYAKINGSAVLGKSKEIVLHYDFNSGSKGWLAGFADYTLGTADLQTIAELRPLPDELGRRGNGFYLQSMNRSDDVFMFLKKRLTSEDGLEARKAYRVFFDIRVASDARTGCLGVGGSPGDSVYLKAGIVASEPVTTVDGTGYVGLLADKGQQSTGGRDAGVIGTIANGTPCTGSTSPYVSLRKNYAHVAQPKADKDGSLWLLAGTDSGFEGLTGLYYESITVRINPAVEPAGSTQLR
jgi:hypothetical protein